MFMAEWKCSTLEVEKYSRKMEKPLQHPGQYNPLWVATLKGGIERMLTMEQIHHIKYLFKNKGKTLRKISSETGHHFNTVKKYVEKTNFNLELIPKKTKPRKLALYVELIDSWLESDLKAKPKQRHTAQRVYNRLKEQFPDFNVSDRSVRAYVSNGRKKSA